MNSLIKSRARLIRAATARLGRRTKEARTKGWAGEEKMDNIDASSLKPLDEALLQRICEYLEGTCQSCGAAIERFDLLIETDELEDALLDANLERCPGCD